jgi:hypothetical protein
VKCVLDFHLNELNGKWVKYGNEISKQKRDFQEAK